MNNAEKALRFAEQQAADAFEAGRRSAQVWIVDGADGRTVYVDVELAKRAAVAASEAVLSGPFPLCSSEAVNCDECGFSLAICNESHSAELGGEDCPGWVRRIRGSAEAVRTPETNQTLLNEVSAWLDEHAELTPFVDYAGQMRALAIRLRAAPCATDAYVTGSTQQDMAGNLVFVPDDAPKTSEAESPPYDLIVALEAMQRHHQLVADEAEIMGDDARRPPAGARDRLFASKLAELLRDAKRRERANQCGESPGMSGAGAGASTDISSSPIPTPSHEASTSSPNASQASPSAIVEWLKTHGFETAAHAVWGTFVQQRREPADRPSTERRWACSHTPRCLTSEAHDSLNYVRAQRAAADSSGQATDATYHLVIGLHAWLKGIDVCRDCDGKRPGREQPIEHEDGCALRENLIEAKRWIDAEWEKRFGPRPADGSSASEKK